MSPFLPPHRGFDRPLAAAGVSLSFDRHVLAASVIAQINFGFDRGTVGQSNAGSL
jgi:hypothetical protein